MEVASALVVILDADPQKFLSSIKSLDSRAYYVLRLPVKRKTTILESLDPLMTAQPLSFKNNYSCKEFQNIVKNNFTTRNIFVAFFF